MEWKNIYRGMLMGASDIIPGVSGGTIAVLLGIYDRLIAAITGLLSKHWKKQLGFLIPLGLGVAAAILSLAKVIDKLMKHYPIPTQFFFLGLILGVLPLLFHKVNAARTFRVSHIVVLVIAVVLIALMDILQTSEGTIIEHMTASTYVLLFASGFAAASAMILPGISGALVFLMTGVFFTVIRAVNALQWDILIVTGLGIIVGIMVMSKVIHFFLNNYYTGTFAAIIGMVLGSIVVVFPGWPLGAASMIASVVTFALGLAAAYLLGKVEYTA